MSNALENAASLRSIVAVNGTSTPAGTSPILELQHENSSVNYVQVNNAPTTDYPVIAVKGTDSTIGIFYGTKGTAPHRFYTHNNIVNEQFRVGGINSNPVNYLHTWGSNPTGNSVTLAAAGQDAQVDVRIQSKGAASTIRFGPDATTTLRIDAPTSQVNSFQMFGGVAGQGATIATLGSDANINLILFPKGTGSVVITGLISRDYADDTAAAAGGVSIGGLYHNAGVVRVRRT